MVWHKYLVDVPEVFKINAHAKRADGKYASFIRKWRETNALGRFLSFAVYADAIRQTAMHGDPPALEALRKLHKLRYRPGKGKAAQFVVDVRDLLSTANIPSESIVAAFIFSTMLPESSLLKAGARLTAGLREGSFEKMVVEFLAAEDSLLAASPSTVVETHLEDRMDVCAISSDQMARPQLKCPRCGGIGHVESKCAGKRPSGLGEQAPMPKKTRRRQRRRRKPAPTLAAATIEDPVTDPSPPLCVQSDGNESDLSAYIASIFEVERKGTHLYLGATIADAGGAGRPGLLGHMLDSGAPRSFIDRTIAESLKMTKIPISSPFSLRGIDGKAIAGGQVTHKRAPSKTFLVGLGPRRKLAATVVHSSAKAVSQSTCL
ncbi:hypothetical protein BCR44DRAFT_31390 [Catenaria anguillulae PL171]|uniref:Uncharacterized protein n=1 Tax=Catenaria anguillulae PL171 TaxID=765915 RepID=A0A1Y2HEY5_9FUNG|nr:hypothetical protein BCR44DRAFT_31390 [Catenaria anguillulae PL171]